MKLQGSDARLPGFLPPHIFEEVMRPFHVGSSAPRGSPKGAGKEELRIDEIKEEVFDEVEEEEEEEVEEEEEEEEEPSVMCQRCHRLRHYGAVEESLRPAVAQDTPSLTAAHFRELLEGVATKKCVVLTIVDVFDFHGSILPNLKAIAGSNPIIVAVNKADLLPVDYKPQRVKQWVLDECVDFAGLERLRLGDIHLISAKSGFGVGPLVDSVRDFAIARNCDIYVVGAANVGKSSFLNCLFNGDGGSADQGGRKKKGGKGGRGGKKGWGEGGGSKSKSRTGITTSPLPGTTLSFLKLNIGSGVALYDTPGLLLPHQLTVGLTPEELKVVVPSRRVDHVTLRLEQGKAVLLGGLGRVEMLEGRPFFLTFFVANGVKIHTTNAKQDLEAFLEKHVGELLTAPSSMDRVRDLGPLVNHDIEVAGNGWKEAGCDVVLSGLGWVSITGVGNCKIR